jgi:hypothetical protein
MAAENRLSKFFLTVPNGTVGCAIVTLLALFSSLSENA